MGRSAVEKMNVEELISKYRNCPDCHITRVKGSMVVIARQKIVEIDKNHGLDFCPLQSLLGNCDIEEYVYKKIREFGFFSPRREISRTLKDVPFGTSEMFMTAMEKGIIEAAVVVCDGAGTVVVKKPEVVQGIGARMNGVFFTSPIPEVIENLRKHGCIAWDDAKIDQLRGTKAAIKEGYKKIAVTVNGYYGPRISEIRKLERNGVSLTIAGVCTTKASPLRARELVEGTDLCWACASKYLREYSSNAVVQLTLGIPIFFYSAKGLEILKGYSDENGRRILENFAKGKQYLIASGRGTPRILVGTSELAVCEAKLPVSCNYFPTPLK